MGNEVAKLGILSWWFARPHLTPISAAAPPWNCQVLIYPDMFLTDEKGVLEGRKERRNMGLLGVDRRPKIKTKTSETIQHATTTKDDSAASNTRHSFPIEPTSHPYNTRKRKAIDGDHEAKASREITRLKQSKHKHAKAKSPKKKKTVKRFDAKEPKVYHLAAEMEEDTL